MEPTTKFDARFSDPEASATPWAEAEAALIEAEGLDVVVEGEAVRITDTAKLQELADAIEAKYGEVWHFDVSGDAFGGQGETPGLVFRVEPAKVLAFAKAPHGHTSFRFS